MFLLQIEKYYETSSDDYKHTRVTQGNNYAAYGIGTTTLEDFSYSI